MFENGLTCFHLRKPKLRLKELDKYILAIPKEYRNRIVLHTHYELASLHGLKGVHHSRAYRKNRFSYSIKIGISKIIRNKLLYTRSYHSMIDVKKSLNIYDYIFLSPVFDSISKNYHKIIQYKNLDYSIYFVISIVFCYMILHYAIPYHNR